MPELSSTKRMFFVLLWITGLALTAPAQGPQTPQSSTAKGTDAESERPLMAGTDGTTYPSCYYMPNPPYTQEARAAKFEGTVLAESMITSDGKIQKVRILKSPGMGLDQNVVSALMTWKCKPATHDGKPVLVRVPILITFRLK